jgi:hypothetical protein
MANNFFFLLENRAVCEIMSKNFAETDRPQMTIWRMRIACWIPKATNTRSEYVILLFYTAALVLRTRLSVALYVQCLCCFLTRRWTDAMRHDFERVHVVNKCM